MLRGSIPRRGSYVLYDRVVCDWMRFFQREEQHARAKDRHERIKDAATRTVASMSLSEANELVRDFTMYHNIDPLSDTIRFIRETHGHTLEPFHYNALLRVFIYNKDRENITQLLDVIFARATYNAQTYASCVDALHAIGGQKSLGPILRLIEQIDASNQANMFVVTDDEAGPSSSRSPVLSSLLHHVCMCRYSPVAMIVVVTWMRAVGAHLSLWDYTAVMSMLLGRSSEFPVFRSYFGDLGGKLNAGDVTFSAVRSRVEDVIASNDIPQSEKVGLRELLEAASASLQRHNVDATAALNVGVANLRVTQLHTHMDRIVEHASRFKGVGPQRHNVADLYHVRLLLHYYLRQHTSAVSMLETAVRAHKVWMSRYGNEDTPYLRKLQSVENPPESVADVARSEAFTFTPAFLYDVGLCLYDVSQQTIRNISAPFRYVTEHLGEQYKADAKAMGYVAATGMLLLDTAEAQKEACASLIEVARASRSGRVPAVTKHQIKSYIEMCCMHPPVNAKMSATAAAEREKWRVYLEARETALALFGSGTHAREMMKTLYYSQNVQPALRSSEEVERDKLALAGLFGPAPPSGSDDFSAGGINSTKRLRPRVLRTPRCNVPSHLHDANVPNVFPQVNLKRRALTRPGADASQLVKKDHDPFVPMWQFLRDSPDAWYLNQQDMYSSLARCLIHRLDWDGLVQLTINTASRYEFNFAMDMEVNKAFAEIGDPCGALPFKIASKLFDGRISDAAGQKKHLTAVGAQ